MSTVTRALSTAGCFLALTGFHQALAASETPTSDNASYAPNAAAVCDNMTSEPFITRNDLVNGQRSPQAKLLLRFVQFTDDHITDDDGQAINGASFLDPLYPAFEAAMRFQEEYSDEVLNDIVMGINTCQQDFPSEFAIITGDSADMTTVAEARRFIDNLDGTYDQLSAFEIDCVNQLPFLTQAAIVQETCTRYTGRGVADTQTPDPNINDPAYQLLSTRTALMISNTEQAAISGRAADGSVNPLRQTATRAPGLPEILRCHAGEPGCINAPLNMPWYVAFGNHDGYIRGTIPLDTPVNEISTLTGRHYMLEQHEFIDEFFQTVSQPVGHGFNLAETERKTDNNPRNDGYYAFSAGQDAVRMIVLNTIIDGTNPDLPDDMLRNPFGLSDGYLDAEQFSWLKAELAQAWQQQQLVIITSHHPDLSFVEYGMFADIAPTGIKAAELNAELASWPNVIAWVAGHTHIHRIRAFKVVDGQGSNGVVSADVQCHGTGCTGFWEIETASLIDHPQQQRLIEVFDNKDGTGTIRGPVLTHGLDDVKTLAEADDRCALYLSDPDAVQAALTEANLDAICTQGGTRIGQPTDRNVELIFKMPVFN